MNKTNIEWAQNPDGSQGYTWNPITGCLNNDNGLCKGGGFPCYAYKLANGRLKPLYLANHNMVPFEKMEDEDGSDHWQFHDPFYPRFWAGRLLELRGSGAYDNAYPDRNAYHASRAKQKGIFVCDMGDLFGVGTPDKWTEQIMEQIRLFSHHRFYLLSKQPQNLIKFSPFPENCWVGVTATTTSMAWIASKQLSQIEAMVKFLSLEPLLSWETSTPYTSENIVAGLDGSLDWLIIGACTGTLEDIKKANYAHKDTDGLMPMPWGKKWTLQPKIEWVREIVEAANKAGILVFLKDNLRPLLIPEDCSKPNYLIEDIFWASEKAQLRQEMPDV